MDSGEYVRKASYYLNTLCGVRPNRRTGSNGNREATDFFANAVRNWDYKLDMRSFDCLDYVSGEVSPHAGDQCYEVFISPYSPGCNVTSEQVIATSVRELEQCACEGKILLLKGEICSEQLMPNNFPFYNPDHHKKIYSLLEQKQPAAFITATTRKPELVGALYPFPLIEDGDFDIPSFFCTEITGEQIAAKKEELFRLEAVAERIPSKACNVVAGRNPEAGEKIVVCAHIDAYGNSPGALDNASGTVVLLLLAEMLRDYERSTGIELVAINGEDNYSAGGEKDYLQRYGDDIPNIALVINLDDVGYIRGKTAYACYECPDEIMNRANRVFRGYSGLATGEPWYQGDHMVFVQQGRPAMAFTSEYAPELMATVTHTSADLPDLVDPGKLVELATALKEFICTRAS